MNRNPLGAVLLAIVAAATMAGPFAADPSAQSVPVFHSGIDLVVLTATVEGPHGRGITGLTADDFSVYEEGVRQTISYFGADDVPADLAVMLDTSGSMADSLPIAVRAAEG